MYDLYISNRNYSSWSLRPWALLRELGIAFTEHLENFAAGSNYARFRRFSPTGRVPCLHDGDLVVWDSLAIFEYLAERHPGVWPRQSAARAWARCASAEMHSGFAALRNECAMSIGIRIRLYRQSEAMVADLARVDELWTEGLVRWGGPWLAGAEFGGVDAFFAPVAFRLRTYGLTLGERSTEYAARLLDAAVIREWEAQALAETARDPVYEPEILARGELLADHRRRP